MAVNKNFVVKNGLEVNSDLILADADTKRVGIGSTIPQYTLDVAGGIGVTNIYAAGVSTFVGFSTFQDSIGVQNDITIAGISTVVGVATFKSDVYVDGNLNVVGDIVYDEVNGRNIYISGLSTFVGFSTFSDSIGIKKDISIAGMSTVVGVATFRSDVYVDGDLNVAGDISYDQVVGREIYISGLSTFVGLSSFVNGVYIGGITTTAGAGGITTTGGDLYVGDNLFVKGDADIAGVLTASSFSGSATIGLSEEGTFIGAGVSLINMASSSGSAIDVSAVTAGVSTVTITPGVSLGLAIALGG